MKNLNRRTPKSRFRNNRSFQVESLEDRRLLAADLEYVIPIGAIRGVALSGLGGAHAIEAAWGQLENASSFRESEQEQHAIDRGLIVPNYLLEELPLKESLDEAASRNIVNKDSWNGRNHDASDLTSGNRGVIDRYEAEIRSSYNDQDFVVIAGYSLGGDAAHSIAHSLNFGTSATEIDVLAIIDASEASAPKTGFRAALSPGAVTPNVHTFFNRWQTNYQFPLDVGTDGRLELSEAKVDDQWKQNDRRHADGSVRKRGCELRDYLKGFCKPFGATKTSRNDHVQIANDPYVNAQFWDQVTTRLNEISIPPAIDAGFVSGSGGRDDVLDQTFTWNVLGEDGDIYLKVVKDGQVIEDYHKVDSQDEYDFNSMGLGEYEFTVFAEGFNGKVSIFETNVVDDDSDPPAIQISTANRIGPNESHGLDNAFLFDVADFSGYSATAAVSQNGTSIATVDVDALPRFDLNGYGLGEFKVTVTARDLDSDGWAGDALSQISTTRLNVTNAAPSVAVGDSFSIMEGGLLSLNAVGSDADPGDTESLQYAWDLNNDGDYLDANVANPVLLWSELAALGVDDDGNFPITVRVSDTFGETAFASSILTITNDAPSIVSINVPPNVSENENTTIVGAFVDAGPSDTHEVIVQWGDGTSSEAIVDQATRTFTASHVYPDDNPSTSPYDDYTLEVTILDDDGGVSGDEIRTAVASTTSVGGVEFPAFASSLPEGTSGLLLDAETTAVPQSIQTQAAAVTNLPHRHTIDYPAVGPFNLPPIQTSVSNNALDHYHTFVGHSQRVTLTGSQARNYFGQNSEPMLNVARPYTTDQDHRAEDVQFEANAKFYYDLDPILYKRPGDNNHREDDPRFHLVRDAQIRNGDIYLTTNGPSQRGSLIIDERRSMDAFTIEFNMRMTGGSGADGMSVGYGPISSIGSFGEEGPANRPGLWVTFDTLNNGGGDAQGIEIWYNNQRKARWTRSNLESNFGRVTIRLYENSNGTSTVGVKHPNYSEFRYNIGVFEPASNWRVGFGARTGASTNDHAIGYLKITDNNPGRFYTSDTLRGTNRIRLEQFDNSKGTLKEVRAYVNRLPGRTNFASRAELDHSHAASLSIAGFDFPFESSSRESATESHSHNLVFSPSVKLVTTDDVEIARFTESTPTFVPFVGGTTGSDSFHAHEIAAGNVSIDSTTVFRYDASRTLVRVHNSAPVVEQVDVENTITENSLATVSVTLSDIGANDTHSTEIHWGDGEISYAQLLPGQKSFSSLHLYSDDNPTGTNGDTYTVSVIIRDDDGGTVSVERDILVDNSTPTLAVPAPFSVDEGEHFQLPLTTFVDAGLDDTHVAVVDWKDGTSQNASIVRESDVGLVLADHEFIDDGVYIAEITVFDDDNASDTQSVAITVNNVNPVIHNLSGTLTGTEGAALTFSALASDPGDDQLTYSWDFGDDSSPVVGINLDSIAHSFAGDGVYAVVLTVTDGDGGSTSASLSVAVSDAAARMLVSGQTEVDEGANYSLTLGEIQDPGNDVYTGIEVDWGDGTIENVANPNTLQHVFAPGISNAVVEVTLIDEFDTRHAIATLNVNVLNISPEIDSMVVPSSSLEGSSVAFAANASDSSGDIVTYFWDFGDGTPVESGVDLTAVNHVFNDNGSYLVTLTVTDETGASTHSTGTIAVSNVAPVVTLAEAPVANEASDFSISIASLTDPGADTPASTIVDWGDGTILSYGTGENLTHRYADGPATHDIQVTVVDEDGYHEQPTVAPVTVANTPPTIVEVTGELTANEAQQLSFNAVATDLAGPLDPLVYEWDFGDGSPMQSGFNLTSVSHAYVDDGSFTLSLRVRDDEGGESLHTETIVISNVIPQVTISGPPVVAEGSEYVLTLGPIVDPGSDSVVLVEVDWGDGQIETYQPDGVISHAYSDGPSNATVAVNLVDEDGTHLAASAVLDVANAAPAISSLDGSEFGAEGDTLQWTVAATDVGVGDEPLFYTWDFGDGSTDISGVGLDQVQHIFADDGNYFVRVTVSDDDGGMTTEDAFVEVADSPPTLNIVSPERIDEGSTLLLDLSDSHDVGTDTISRWYVDWGDGTLTSHRTPLASHRYLDGPLSPEIVVSVLDEDDYHQRVASFVGEVTNAPPTFQVNEIPSLVGQGQTIDVIGQVSDLGVLDAHSVQVDWGNGFVQDRAEQANSSFEFANQYSSPGVYTITITVADSDGDSDQASFPLVVLPTLSVIPWESGSETGTRDSVFRVVISAALEDDLEVSLEFGGSASVENDYSLPAASITIPSGETSVLYSISTLEDADVEGPESIQVSIAADESQVILSESRRTASTMIVDNDFDDDQDGVAEATERLAPNLGDGNNDGVPDADQAHVSSLPNAVNGQYVTLVADSSLQIQDVVATAHRGFESRPNEINFPYGIFEYQLAGLAVGANTSVKMLLPAGASVSSFYKFGPTPEDLDPHWYDFSFDAASGTGATINGNEVTLHFVDGQRGDSDLIANGVVKDPGGAAQIGSIQPKLNAGGPYVVAQAKLLTLSATLDGGLNAIGEVEWDLDYEDENFEVDATGTSVSTLSTVSGTKTLAARVTTDSGETILSTTAMTVLNLPPIIQNETADTTENQSVAVDVLANDFDGAGNPLSLLPETVTIASAVDSSGNPIDISTSTVAVMEPEIEFSPGQDFDFLGIGETAVVGVGYRVTDNDNIPLTASGKLELSISGENDLPSVSGGVAENATEDDLPFEVDLLRGASDVDLSDVLSVDALTHTSGDDSGVTIGINGLTVDPSAYNHLAVGESGVIVYSYNVIDGNGGTVAQTATITIVGENDVPTVGVDAKDSVLIEEGQQATQTGTWSDIDLGDVVTLSVNMGTVSLLDDGTWTWSFDATDGPLQSEVVVTAEDSNRATGAASFQLVVENVAPEITALRASATFESPGSLDGDLVLTNIGQETAAYHNSYGYYHFDHRGKPTTGKIVWSNMKENAGSRFVLNGINPVNVEFFVVPDGKTLNEDLGNGTEVTFHRDANGNWFAQTLDGQPIVGRGAHAFFSNRRLNSDRRTHVTDNSNLGNQNWEDLVGGGDRDFDDINVDVVRSAAVTLSGVYQDVGSMDEHSLTIRWDDGTETFMPADDPRIDQSTGSFEVTHHYVTGGIFSIEVMIDDGDGGSSEQTTLGVVSGVRRTQSGELQVVGSPANDRIEISPDNRNRSVDVRYKFGNASWKSSQFGIESVDDTLIYLLAGDDRLNISQQSALAGMSSVVHGGEGVDRIVGGRASDEIYGGPGDDRIWGHDGNDYLSGGDGNDRIYAGRGNDVLLGGEGRDRLQGDRGRDIVVGGAGRDDLRGGRDQDILIAGASWLDRAQLFGSRDVWTDDSSYEDRVDRLSSVGGPLEPRVQVLADEQVDSIRGEGGRDYFFATLSGENTDLLRDEAADEFVEDLIEADEIG